MKECARCGACCTYFIFHMGGLSDDADHYLTMHHMHRVRRGYYEVPLKCEMLFENKCIIYGKRPVYCRQFKPGGAECTRARERQGLLPL